jgi:hypothetical protein
LQIRQGPNAGFQFKTHPNIDKAGYGNGVLGLKDPSRPFPTGVLQLVEEGGVSMCLKFCGVAQSVAAVGGGKWGSLWLNFVLL